MSGFQIGFPVLLAITLILSAWGCGIFFLLPEYLGNPLLEGYGKSEEAASQESRVFRPPIYIFVLLTACNLIVCCMLYFYYNCSSDNIILTTATISFLWSCAYVDFKVHLIPNKILLISILLRIAWLLVEILLPDTNILFILLSSLIAAAALIITSLLCRLLIPNSVGMGDVKILGVMGLYLGMDKVWGALFLAFFTLFVACVFLLITKKASRKSEVAFAPFLLAGTIIGALAVGI